MNLQYVILLFFKVFKFLWKSIRVPFDFLITYLIFYINGVSFRKFTSRGFPIINVSLGGKFFIGTNFKLNNYLMSNPIGRFSRCIFIVGKNGKLVIGNNVGVSSISIVCHDEIEIKDNTIIGGNVVIYDTDFHSLNKSDRILKLNDLKMAKTKKIMIGSNTFIGAHSTILKGVIIGDNSIVGACSVVTKNIPSNEIWAGNPARFIREI
jgi:acetyltransferase-like isoleucine patch superfamily enzyme